MVAPVLLITLASILANGLLGCRHLAR